MWIAAVRFGNLANHSEDHAMQNQDQDNHNPVIDRPDQGAREGKPGQDDRAPLPGDSRTHDAAAISPRRRTQEQGQGDLDDDWQDTNPAAEAKASTVSPSLSGPEGS
jgi:hypothetical protein